VTPNFQQHVTRKNIRGGEFLHSITIVFKDLLQLKAVAWGNVYVKRHHKALHIQVFEDNHI
jgi:hypothetical protein